MPHDLILRRRIHAFRSLPSVAALAFLPIGLFRPAPSLAQGILGRVTDSASRTPIAGARVRLIPVDSGTAVTAIADSVGRFVLKAVTPGAYSLTADRIGYMTITEGPIRLRSGEFTEVQLMLGVQAVPLNALIVATEKQVRDLEQAGYYNRKKSGIGKHIDQQMIDQRNPVRTTDIFEQVSGARILSTRDGKRVVVLRGGVSTTLKTPFCPPYVYVDGLPNPGVFDFDMLNPRDIAALEVYRGPSEVPPQYSGANHACGVVLVWLKRGGS